MFLKLEGCRSFAATVRAAVQAGDGKNIRTKRVNCRSWWCGNEADIDVCVSCNENLVAASVDVDFVATEMG